MTSDDTYFNMVDVPLKPALEIAFANSPGGKATHYKERPDKLILAWHEGVVKLDPDFRAFLIPLTAETAYQVVLDWLKQKAQYPPGDSYADSTGKSFKIYCETWGNIDHNSYAFVAIEPVTVGYSK